MENGILSVRNLGQKSAKEIKQFFFEECYSRLLPYEKTQYWQEVIDNCLEKHLNMNDMNFAIKRTEENYEKRTQ